MQQLTCQGKHKTHVLFVNQNFRNVAISREIFMLGMCYCLKLICVLESACWATSRTTSASLGAGPDRCSNQRGQRRGGSECLGNYRHQQSKFYKFHFYFTVALYENQQVSCLYPCIYNYYQIIIFLLIFLIDHRLMLVFSIVQSLI